MFFEELKKSNDVVSNIVVSFVPNKKYRSHTMDTIPFPQCKIMEVTHYPYFAPKPSMPRDFRLIADGNPDYCDSLIRSNELKRFWLPLTPEDTWKTLIRKADMLAELSGDRHHVYLEAFHVIDDILIPSFGS